MKMFCHFCASLWIKTFPKTMVYLQIQYKYFLKGQKQKKIDCFGKVFFRCGHSFMSPQALNPMQQNNLKQ